MPPKLGILAGGGDLPRHIIQVCQDSGREFFVIAFKDQTAPETVAGVDHAWVRLGAAGRAVKLLREAGARELVMAGAIRRPSLSALRPDTWAAGFFARSVVAAGGDDALLTALVRTLEEDEGFRVVGPDDLLPGVLADQGVYGAHSPDTEACPDITRGIHAARGIGALDIGQAAVVREGVVVAVEAADGTDAMLARAAAGRPNDAGGVLVKVRKPGQESRVDLPTIGAATVRAAAEAGLAGIAVEAGGVLIIDRAAVVEAADSAGLFVVGVPVERSAPA